MSKEERYYYEEIIEYDAIPIRIKDIEAKLLNESSLYAQEIVDRLNTQDQRIKELEEQLAITEKALEYACEYGCFDSDLLLREAQEELKNG